MSDAQPTTEYLGDSPPPRSGGRRWGLVGGAAVAVLGVAAAAAWGVSQFMGAGPEPATAAPANTLAYVGLDLDPSGGQKIEALRTLRKFPALKDKLGIGSTDDLKKAILQKLVDASSCPGLDYADDIEPWIGDKVGLGAVPGDGSGASPRPFGIVQVTDQDKARQGVATLERCDAGSGTGSHVGIGFVGDYMVVAQSDKIASGIVADAGKGSLADDPAYQKWVAAAGGDGILTAYVSPDGGQAMAKMLQDQFTPDMSTTSSSATLTADPSATPGVPQRYRSAAGSGRASQAFSDFRGGALVARFDNQSLEVELAAGGLPTKVSTGGDSGITDLPSSTAMAFGVGVSDTFAQDLVDGLRRSMGSEQVDSLLREVQVGTGLSLPGDLQTLLGNGVSLAVDDSVDPNALFGGSSPSDLPLGLRINGDPAKVMPVLQKVLDATGAGAQGVVAEQGSGAVAVGVSSDYVKELAGDGDLGGQSRFAQALPDLRPDGGALYVDFDAGDWLVRTLDNVPDSGDVRANLQPLSALGISGDTDGGTMHAVLRLGTD